MKIIYILLITCLNAMIVGCAFIRIIATPSIIGEVRDSKTGLPIEHAKVSFVGYEDQTSTITTSDGRFFIPQQTKRACVPVGFDFAPPRGVLMVEAPGYALSTNNYVDDDGDGLIETINLNPK